MVCRGETIEGGVLLGCHWGGLGVFVFQAGPPQTRPPVNRLFPPPTETTTQVSSYAGDYSSASGHFSQMVWKGTTQLGCGYSAGCKMYVCHYNPPGNVIGQFAANVFV